MGVRSTSKVAAPAIPRAALWIVPNAGHGPIAGDRRERFVETAAAFLREGGVP